MSASCKTEVAVIASFKAVSDGMQVAVLCPTTILAEQHFHTFMQRYEGYPVTIKVLDRFVPDSEVVKTLKDLKEGNVDILIERTVFFLEMLSLRISVYWLSMKNSALVSNIRKESRRSRTALMC